MNMNYEEFNRVNELFRIKAEEYFAEIKKQQPLKSFRVIAKMAKNVNPGDLIEFNGFGWREIGGWSMTGGIVTLSAHNLPIMQFPANERVRIQRRVVS